MAMDDNVNDWQLSHRAEVLLDMIGKAVDGWQRAIDQLGPNGGPEAAKLRSAALGWSPKETPATWDDLLDARLGPDILAGNHTLDFRRCEWRGWNLDSNGHKRDVTEACQHRIGICLKAYTQEERSMFYTQNGTVVEW